MKNVIIIFCGILITIAVVWGMLGMKISNQQTKKAQTSSESAQVNTLITPSNPTPQIPSEQPSKQFSPQPTDPKPDQTSPTPPQSQPIPADTNQNRGNYDEMIDAYRI
jgi:cell division protein FtsN